jgi:hypothetical protein
VFSYKPFWIMYTYWSIRGLWKSWRQENERKHNFIGKFCWCITLSLTRRFWTLSGPHVLGLSVDVRSPFFFAQYVVTSVTADVVTCNSNISFLNIPRYYCHYYEQYIFSACKYFGFVWNISTIILPVVLYGCETWSLTLREEHRLRVFENRVLRRIF